MLTLTSLSRTSFVWRNCNSYDSPIWHLKSAFHSTGFERRKNQPRYWKIPLKTARTMLSTKWVEGRFRKRLYVGITNYRVFPAFNSTFGKLHFSIMFLNFENQFKIVLDYLRKYKTKSALTLDWTDDVSKMILLFYWINMVYGSYKRNALLFKLGSKSANLIGFVVDRVVRLGCRVSLA